MSECTQREAALLCPEAQLGQLILACAWEEAVSRRQRTSWENVKVQG